jgi:hypothetical protein
MCHVYVALSLLIYISLQPTWARTWKELPPPHCAVLEDILGFLDRLAKWIARRKDSRSKRDGLACEVMRDAPEVWPGVGVYTITEVFFVAGKCTSQISLTDLMFQSAYTRCCSLPSRGRSL